MVEQLVWLLPLLPMLASLWIFAGMVTGFNRGETGEGHTARVVTLACGLALLGALLLDGAAWWRGATLGTVVLAPWLYSHGLVVHVSFALDLLGLAAATLVALIALLTVRFSIHYLHREAGFQRFFAILSLFTGAMLLFVLAGNGVMAFAGWELMGLCSYLLIGFAHDRPTATGNASRAFVTNRFGDGGFLLALVFSLLWIHSTDWLALTVAADHLDILRLGLVAWGFVLAALAKSGQMPFVSWLGRALEGPTPSSAIFYGSLMIHAGIFLLLRLQELLVHIPLLMAGLVLLGLLTLLYAALVGLVQTDVKSALLLAAQGQVGVMLVMCGLGWFDLAGGYLALHALWRLHQFLNAPAYMHQMALPVRPARRGIFRHPWLHTAALQRFWIDNLAEALITRPTHRLSQDVIGFDNQVIDRLTGQPAPSTLQPLSLDDPQREEAIRGWGVMGVLLEKIATLLTWFEHRLILPLGGHGLTTTLRRLGGVVLQADRLLAQPRYLVLLVMLTFAVIL